MTEIEKMILENQLIIMKALDGQGDNGQRDSLRHQIWITERKLKK